MAKFCAGCGNRLGEGAGFCPNCGTPAGAAPAAPQPAAPPTPYQPPYQPQPQYQPQPKPAPAYQPGYGVGAAPPYGYGAAPAGGDPAVRAAIGSNAEYYLRKWAAMDASGSTVSWNWAALFLNGLWLAYRRLWGAALVFLAVIVGITAFVIALVTTRTIEVEVGFGFVAFSTLPAIWVGARGNDLYRSRIRRILVETGATPHDPASIEWARQRGGASFASGVAFYLLLSVVLGAPFAYLVTQTDVLDGLKQELHARYGDSISFDSGSTRWP
jgi:hypothetical protein